MRVTIRSSLAILVVLLVVISAAGAAMVLRPDFPWRTIVVGRKLVGQAGDATWLDILYMVRPNSGFHLRRMAAWGDPYPFLIGPYESAQDIQKGKELFAHNCSTCHGDEGSGGVGPKLVGRRLKHGEGDWAIYRTAMDGVEGTAMRGGLLARGDVWRVIAYLHELRSRAPGGAATAVQAAAAMNSVTSAELIDSSDAVGKWLLHSGAYNGQRFSRDTQIDSRNVAGLKVQWIHQFASSEVPNESTPIVVGNLMFVSVPPGTLVAIDVESGKELWQYNYAVPQHLKLIYLATSRGVSVLGRNVYWTTPDAHLLALDAATGKLIWDKTVANYADGYSMTSPALPVGDLVVAGVAGGDFTTRGFLVAYDAVTGAVRWRFNTVPGPGEPGHDTWAGDSWKIGGAAAWGIGAYDPELGLIYWGTGNPNPDFNASLRAGDNLYSNCELALDAKTGKLVWYFQFTPGDDHSWDAIQTPALIDLTSDGATQKLLAVANRNGFFYVLDRRNGRFVRAVAYVKQTWARGFTPAGRPIRAENSSPTRKGNLVYPSGSGATNWTPSAYSPSTQLYYAAVNEHGGVYFQTEPPPKPTADRPFMAGTWYYVEGEASEDYVRAIDPATATMRWEYKHLTATPAPRGGLLATAGGLVFGSDGSALYALDAGTGARLWSFNAGAQISGSPITYRSGGRQVIAVVAGSDLLTFTLAEPEVATRGR